MAARLKHLAAKPTMLELMVTAALLNLMACMSPGPDFAIVTRNTLINSRTAGLFTSLGVAAAVMIHATYCSLGLALIIAHSNIAFNSIKLIGGSYLIYTGLASWNSHAASHAHQAQTKTHSKKNKKAFLEGFITNLTNPKCMLFFLAIFTMVIRDYAMQWIDVFIILTFFIVTLSWFSLLTWMISHKKIEPHLQRWQNILVKLTSVFLIGFGISLFFVST